MVASRVSSKLLLVVHVICCVFHQVLRDYTRKNGQVSVEVREVCIGLSCVVVADFDFDSWSRVVRVADGSQHVCEWFEWLLRAIENCKGRS
jgi:hypothetical protein